MFALTAGRKYSRWGREIARAWGMSRGECPTRNKDPSVDYEHLALTRSRGCGAADGEHTGETQVGVFS